MPCQWSHPHVLCMQELRKDTSGSASSEARALGNRLQAATWPEVLMSLGQISLRILLYAQELRKDTNSTASSDARALENRLQAATWPEVLLRTLRLQGALRGVSATDLLAMAAGELH